MERTDQIPLTYVVAVARNGVIGRDGELPWRLSSDLKLFRRLTMGKPILMGRRTWESLPKKPLDGRENIVVTRDAGYSAAGAHVFTDLGAGVAFARQLAQASGADEVAVIGGAAIYEALMGEVRRIYLTEVEADPEGDTFFPPLNSRHWIEVSREALPTGPNDQHAASLVVLERANPADP